MFLEGEQGWASVPFETLPVVHVERGGVLPEYPRASADAAMGELTRRFQRIVLVDAEGIRANDPSVEFLQLAAKRRSVWVDAGSRFATDAMDLFIAGAELVTMRWNTLDSTDELEEAAEMAQPGSLFVGLEFPRGQFLKNRKDARDAAEVAAYVTEMGLGIVLIAHEPTAASLRALPTTGERWLQGAPRALLADAQELGFHGALLSPSEIPPEETS